MSELAEIEALLFVAGEEGITQEDIARACKSTEDHVSECLIQLQSTYENDPDKGITLLKSGKVYKLVAKEAYTNQIREYAQSPNANKLSRSMIETLAIIAYKQPVTRMGIEDIRGVSSSHALQKLKGRQMIKELDRLDAPGKPVLYGTTDYFLNYFDLDSLQALPDIDNLPLNKEISLFDLDQIEDTQENDQDKQEE